jgi:hypothetical protein
MRRHTAGNSTITILENSMRHHLPTLALFGAATVLWYFGMRDNAALVMVAAGLVELFAWRRLLKRRHTG